MRNVFVAFTPYHILLSCGIVLDQTSSAENILIAILEGVNAELLLQVLRESDREIFANMYSLPGALHKHSIFYRRAISRENARTAMSTMRDFIADKAYVFNDARAESQAILHYTKEHNSSAKAIYVEDGAAVYSSETRKARGRMMKLLGKLYYGPWWEKVTYLGGSHWIDEIHVAFPELVRPELRSKKVTRLPCRILLNARMKELAEEMCKAVAIQDIELRNLDAILIIAHSEFAKQVDGYREVIEHILASVVRQGLHVAVKYHPREPAGDYLSLSDKGKVLVLPQSIPVEILYIQALHNLKLVIGDISTSLYTAKWLLKEALVISIAPLLKYGNPHLLDIFCKLGVVLVEEKDLFDNVVSEHKLIRD